MLILPTLSFLPFVTLHLVRPVVDLAAEYWVQFLTFHLHDVKHRNISNAKWNLFILFRQFPIQNMLYKRFLMKCFWFISLKYKTFHSKLSMNFPGKALILRHTESHWITAFQFMWEMRLRVERGLRVKAKHLLWHEPENKLIQELNNHSMAVAHSQWNACAS